MTFTIHLCPIGRIDPPLDYWQVVNIQSKLHLLDSIQLFEDTFEIAPFPLSIWLNYGGQNFDCFLNVTSSPGLQEQ